MYKKMRKIIKKVIKQNVPDCVLFSGGIDSSVVLYESKLINENVVGITVGVKENNCDDIKYSKFIAEKLGIKLLVYEVDRNYILSKVDEAIKILKSFNPEWISSTITLLLGIEFAKENGFKNVGSGEGADDLFGSFPFFKKYDGNEEDLDKIIDLRFRNIPVMTDEIASYFNMSSVTPYREDIFVDYVKSIPINIRMKENEFIKTKYPLRKSYIDYLPYESIVRPQTMAFTGSGVFEILKELENQITDSDYNEACTEIFKFKSKLEYALFKKYINYFEYKKVCGKKCIHCGSKMNDENVNCSVCQTVQFDGKELKFDA